MKVVLLSTGCIPVPPSGYSGLEQVVADLAETLADRGHEIYVVCPDESTIGEGRDNIQPMKCGPCNGDARGWEAQALQKYAALLLDPAFKDAVIHDHTWAKGIYLLKKDHPELHVMSTLHGMLCYGSPPPVEKPCMAGISKKHADLMAQGLNIPVKFVYNGINLDRYPYRRPEEPDRYLFLARMTQFKGAHVFADLMRFTQQQGDLVGDDKMVEDQNYVSQLKAFCEQNPVVKYWGGVSRERAAQFFRHAKAYILPCSPEWQEPFGLTVIEAMASGCPVIATKSGAIPELVIDGVTGILVDSIQDLPEIINSGRICAIKSEDCRKRAEEFSRERMAIGYEELYNQVLAGGW